MSLEKADVYQRAAQNGAKRLEALAAAMSGGALDTDPKVYDNAAWAMLRLANEIKQNTMLYEIAKGDEK